MLSAIALHIRSRPTFEKSRMPPAVRRAEKLEFLNVSDLLSYCAFFV